MDKEEVSAMARDVSDVRVAIARIEEKVNRILDDYELIEDIERRLDEVEREAAVAKAWGSGAAAAAVAVAGAVAWMAARVPSDWFLGR